MSISKVETPPFIKSSKFFTKLPTLNKKNTSDNLTLSEVIEGLFLPHAQNDCKIAVSSSLQSLIEFIYFILAICDSPC